MPRAGPGPPDSLRYEHSFGVPRSASSKQPQLLSDTVLPLALPSPCACQLCDRPPRADDLRCCQDSICCLLINEVVDYTPAVSTVFSLTSHTPTVGSALSHTHTAHCSLWTWDPSAVWTQVLSSLPVRKLQETLPSSF